MGKVNKKKYSILSAVKFQENANKNNYILIQGAIMSPSVKKSVVKGEVTESLTQLNEYFWQENVVYNKTY